MDDLESASAGYVAEIKQSQDKAAQRAGTIAVVRSLQEQIWDRHAREELMPLDAEVEATKDLLMPYPISAIGYSTVYWHEDPGFDQSPVAFHIHGDTPYDRIRILKKINDIIKDSDFVPAKP